MTQRLQLGGGIVRAEHANDCAGVGPGCDHIALVLGQHDGDIRFGRRLPANDAAAGTLLHDMRQFMGDQSAAPVNARLVLTRRENDVVADSVGVRVHGPRGCIGTRIRVDPHSTEVVPHAGGHEAAGRSIERRSRLAHHVLYHIRCFHARCHARRRYGALDGGALFLAGRALAAQDCRVGHPHDAVRDSIRLPFQRIIDRAYTQFRLQGTQPRLIADAARAGHCRGCRLRRHAAAVALCPCRRSRQCCQCHRTHALSRSRWARSLA